MAIFGGGGDRMTVHEIPITSLPNARLEVLRWERGLRADRHAARLVRAAVPPPSPSLRSQSARHL
eukprot:2462501-Pleurochrysis_carterae.AAC.4